MIDITRITQKQAPQFRALIKTDDGTLFDPSTHLATAAELAQEGIDAAPISCTVYRSTSTIAPYNFSTADAQVVTGYENIEIPASAFVDTSGQDPVEYNFAYTLENRAAFAFESAGIYFVDFLLYPKTGAALAWRVGVEVG
jgi:hypothetical protein